MRFEGYYHAAYAVTLAVYAIYAASLWWRSRALARREAAVQAAVQAAAQGVPAASRGGTDRASASS